MTAYLSLTERAITINFLPFFLVIGMLPEVTEIVLPYQPV
jgi:hypothetical protein